MGFDIQDPDNAETEQLTIKKNDKTRCQKRIRLPSLYTGQIIFTSYSLPTQTT
jgi:hypothetical protein